MSPLSCLPSLSCFSLLCAGAPSASLLSAPGAWPCHMHALCSGSVQGGTDLEKHRDLLVVENERLRQEMRRFEAELQELRAKPVAPCAGCEHSQVSTEPPAPRGLGP